jgi:uncharacterized protein
MDRLAEHFSDAGFVTLTYDHRSFGKSDGMPRQQVDLGRQVDDAFDAVTFLESMTSRVDASRIAIRKYHPYDFSERSCS